MLIQNFSFREQFDLMDNNSQKHLEVATAHLSARQLKARLSRHEKP